MTTGGYGTTTAEMERAGRHVHSVNEAVQAELAALRTKLAPLAGFWQGGAATEFAALMARWDTDARTLNDALAGIGQAVLGSSATYRQHEDEQASGMSAIRAALG